MNGFKAGPRNQTQEKLVAGFLRGIFLLICYQIASIRLFSGLRHSGLKAFGILSNGAREQVALCVVGVRV